MNLHAVCMRISQRINYTTQPPCSPQANLLLCRKGLGYQLKVAETLKTVVLQVPFRRQHDSTCTATHAMGLISVYGAFWTLSVTIGLEFQSPGFN